MILRVLVAKPGLDGHDRGAKYIARVLKENGMEVIYTGIRKTPEEIAKIALDEDVNIVILHNLTGAHNSLFIETKKQLDKLKMKVSIIGVGIIPKEDEQYLLKNGINKIFTAGSNISEFLKYLKETN